MDWRYRGIVFVPMDLESIDKAIRKARMMVAELEVERGKCLQQIVNDKQLMLFKNEKIS